MDPGRRRLLVALALVPALPRGALCAAASQTAPAEDRLTLRASAIGGGTRPLGYGEVPPVLRARLGTPLRIALENRLPGPTSLDLHGLRGSPALGGPGPLGGTVAAGATAEFAVMPPDAGTSWFHPWLLDAGPDATAQGLSGVLVVDEAAPLPVDADLVAVLTDRWRPPDGPSATDALLLDGLDHPRRETLRPGSRVRLRVVNASTRQAVTFACTGASVAVVAIDGQPSALFRPRGDAVPMGPGGRYDLIVDLPRVPGAEVGFSTAAGEAALVLRAEGEPREPRGPVTALPPNPSLPAAIALERATRATLVATRGPGTPEAWAINGALGTALPATPLFRAKRGSPVALTFRNAGPVLAAFRVHGFALRLLHDLDDGWEPYWRDTVTVQPGATHHAAFVADTPGRWLIESPYFAQAAGGLRSWFEIT